MTVAASILAGAALLAGVLAGWLHFASLRRVADRLARGEIGAVGLQVLRLALLAGFLALSALAGPAVLIAAAFGILAGRALALRRVR